MTEETNVTNQQTVTTAETAGAQDAQQEQVQDVQTYTADEVARMLQQETDRRVTSALAKQKKEYEQKLSLAKLDGVERERAEAANRIADLEAQLTDYKQRDRKNEAKAVFATRGLPTALVDHITLTDDVEQNQKLIEELDGAWKAALAEAVKQKFAGNGKVTVGTTPADAPDPKKMSLADKQRLYNEDPAKYNALYGK